MFGASWNSSLSKAMKKTALLIDSLDPSQHKFLSHFPIKEVGWLISIKWTYIRSPQSLHAYADTNIFIIFVTVYIMYGASWYSSNKIDLCLFLFLCVQLFLEKTHFYIIWFLPKLSMLHYSWHPMAYYCWKEAFTYASKLKTACSYCIKCSKRTTNLIL